MPKIAPTHYRRLVCIFEKEGFVYSRTKGDHLVYTKTGTIRPLVIPMYDQVPVFIIRNLMRTASVTRERFFELIEQC